MSSELRYRQQKCEYCPLCLWEGLVAGLSVSWYFPCRTHQHNFFIGVMALASFISSIVVALSGHAYLANAPDNQLDERELSQRNAAYFRAYQISAVAVLVGLIGIHRIAIWTDNIASPALYENYLTVIFFAHLVLPASILAWREAWSGDCDE